MNKKGEFLLCFPRIQFGSNLNFNILPKIMAKWCKCDTKTFPHKY